jgi:diguanylate cyclase (GGDEF)-like protein
VEYRGKRLDDSAGTTTPLRVLLVEPDPRTALWISEMLRASWHESMVIAHAERLADAIGSLSLATTGCVLLDVSGMGEEWPAAADQLRGVAPEVPLLVISDRAEDEAALEALRVGAQDYLHRGDLCPSQLRRAIKYAIERKQAEVALVHRALHDSLTGLPNRALFLDRLHVALDRARRSAALVAVLFLDVDNFKDINDSAGHASGDLLLVELAARLRTMLRPMDTVARFGGDEFTFLFEELADEREVVLIAERIARACKIPIPLEYGETTVSVSMGIAMVADPRTPVESVIREADAAMYRAKERGRGGYEVFDESTRNRAHERIELESALRRALAEDQFRVHYQPSFSLGEHDSLVGLEALLRWEHPERGLIGAEEFIALAEESGLVLEIGQFVLTEVLRALARWRARRPDMTITVNLSLRELEDIDLPATLAAALRAAGVAPEALCVEIAESAMARNPVQATRVLRRLREMGVQTTIDDFGTGSSSVLALRELPVDAIKLHGSLLAGLGGAHSGPVVGAMVEFAHALGLRVMAEGVETVAQADELRALGCDSAQGFLFARPLPEDEIGTLLDRADGEREYSLNGS